MRFTRLYEELKFSDVFKAATPEELDERRLKRIVDNYGKKKLSDGTWEILGPLALIEYQLSSLKSLNASIVDGNFSCAYNFLTSLEGCPKEVKGDFCCFANRLTSLEGCPKKVDGDFDIGQNPKFFCEEDVRAICDVKGSIIT